MPMDVLHKLRRYQARIARASVAVFAATWLGLALQPCHAAGAAPAPPEAPAHVGGGHAGHPCHGSGDSAPPAAPAHDESLPDCPFCPGGHAGPADCRQRAGIGCCSASAPVLGLLYLKLSDLSLAPVNCWRFEVAAPTDLPAARPAAEPEPPPGVPFQERFCTHLE